MGISDVDRIFFETHFNTLLNCESPRSKRKKELERRLAQIQLPAYLKHKIRRSLEKHESDALRRSRLIAQKGRHAVKVGSYEIVKILGQSQTSPGQFIQKQGRSLSINELTVCRQRKLWRCPSRERQRTPVIQFSYDDELAELLSSGIAQDLHACTGPRSLPPQAIASAFTTDSLRNESHTKG